MQSSLWKLEIYSHIKIIRMSAENVCRVRFKCIQTIIERCSTPVANNDHEPIVFPLAFYYYQLCSKFIRFKNYVQYQHRLHKIIQLLYHERLRCIVQIEVLIWCAIFVWLWFHYENFNYIVAIISPFLISLQDLDLAQGLLHMESNGSYSAILTHDMLIKDFNS